MVFSSHLRTSAFLASVALLATLPVAAHAREAVRAVGSSTVYPFVTIAAEAFGKQGKFKTPIIESTGTGGGFKLFCTGLGADNPDINNASREMTESEKDLCSRNGVGEVTEIAIGYDGIVMASGKKSTMSTLTKAQIFMALGKQVPKDGQLVPNPYQNWSDIDPSLPKQPIVVYGPPPTSGTRDAFVEMALEPTCKELPEFKAAIPDEKERVKACKIIREDGKYVEAGEDDNLIIKKIETNSSALGILGYSYVAENGSRVKGLQVDGVTPTFENIASEQYKLSRKLYIYVKNDHRDKIPGLKEFVGEVASDAAMGENGYMVQRGLIPLHDKERAASIAKGKAISGK